MYDTIPRHYPTAIIGARLYYVLFELDRYLANPAEIFALRDGGLAIYGGVIACIFALWLVCRHKKDPAARYAGRYCFRPAHPGRS